MLDRIILVMDMEAIYSDDWMTIETVSGDIKIQLYPSGLTIVNGVKDIDITWSQWDRIVDFVNSRR